MNSPNKIIKYLLLTALMVVSFACGLVINNTSYGYLGWGILLVANLSILAYLLKQ